MKSPRAGHKVRSAFWSCSISGGLAAPAALSRRGPRADMPEEAVSVGKAWGKAGRKLDPPRDGEPGASRGPMEPGPVAVAPAALPRARAAEVARPAPARCIHF